MEQGPLVSCIEAKDLIEALEITAGIEYKHREISVCQDDARADRGDPRRGVRGDRYASLYSCNQGLKIDTACGSTPFRLFC